MTNKNSKQTKKYDSFKLSDQYLKKNKSDDDESVLNEHLQNLKLEHELQVNDIITKNKKLLAILAHDLKDPIGSIVGHLQLLKNRIRTHDENAIKAGIDNTLKSAEASFLLLENLLNWVITENNKKTFQQEYIDLTLLVQNEIENVESFASQKQIKIYTKDIPNIEVFVDENMIKSVFRNILHNAIKNTFIKGEIIISITIQSEYVEISIRDNGIGIKDGIQKSLFINKSSNLILNRVKEPGNGFGLIFCKEIIDLHNGEIGVISERGKGSEFKFTLPLGPI